MLLELKVSNFAIIENVHIQFGAGLNILSGETGAGKSFLLKSLALLMGQKGSVESIRSGATQASVEGRFSLKHRKDLIARLKEMGIDVEENELIVKRVIAEDKSRIYLNGSISTLNNLRDVVSPLIEVAGNSTPLIEMTGQFENRNLLSKFYHLDLLDQYAGAWDLRLQYQALFHEHADLQKQIKQLQLDSTQRAQRLDFLNFQRDEIAKLDLSPGEDIELEQNIKELKSLTKLHDFLSLSEEGLLTDDDSASSRLSTVLKKSAELSLQDMGLAPVLNSFEQAKALIEDALYEMRSRFSKLDADPSKLEGMEHRLSQIRKLQKKFGASVDDILKSLLEIEIEIANLSNSDVSLEKLQKSAAQLHERMQKIAKDMHERRRKASKLMIDSVNHELLDLNMKGVQFGVSIAALAELNSTGLSEVEFTVKISAKEPERALAKAASGGELSRILLSLKRVVGMNQQPRTYLFDEVDTGVSGTTAEKVGRKLSSIAKGQQVICVTHLPQVAAFADLHFLIEKSPVKGTMAMEVSELKTKNRVQEIARLISGEKITKTSLAHAEQLLSEAKI